MKKTILSILLACSGLLAEVTNLDVTPEFINEKKIKIIDIRTQSEWKEMGVISGAHLITFFAENNKYNGEFFLKELDAVIEKDEQFAIISNSSSRTKLVSNFLGHKHEYNVINLVGGMSKLLEDGYEVEVYDPNKKREAEPVSLKTGEDEVEEVSTDNNITTE
ncbi:MAG: Unknown protein [uncultured Sulfurovum sp.]|uniref:Rhodanese domain-containing protein n=1 Tax=uncultured Sulfurovum sp. TaxID=269237 RepID=A0A6S6S4Z5_9BACT|nr:MAG: Unknown protein [uncultured Sulfurovum sp.]